MWTIHVDGGPRRVNHAACAIGDKVYSFGGYTHGMEENCDIDIFILDTTTFRWKEIKHSNTIRLEGANGRQNQKFKDVPRMRYGHTVVEYQGKIYLFGGAHADNSPVDSLLFEFDPASYSWRCIQTDDFQPPKLDGHTAVVVDDQMIVFGGYNHEERDYSEETYCFDFKQDKWSHIIATGNRPTPRDFHTALAIKGLMYVFGGRSQLSRGLNQYYMDVHFFDPKTQMWTMMQPGRRKFGLGPGGRRSHTAWVYNDKMYIFGGYHCNFDAHLSDFWCYDPDTNGWTQLFPKALVLPPCARRRCSSVVVGDRVFIFGGTTNVLRELSELHVFDYKPSLSCFAAQVVIKNSLHKLIPDILPLSVRKQLQDVTEANKFLGAKIAGQMVQDQESNSSANGA